MHQTGLDPRVDSLRDAVMTRCGGPEHPAEATGSLAAREGSDMTPIL